MIDGTGDIDDGQFLFGTLFPEIASDGFYYHEETYARTRDRIISSMQALLWMHADEYDAMF